MKQLYFLFLTAILLAPSTVLAQTPTNTVNLTNPLGTTDVRDIIATIIKGALGISGSVALLMFIYGGLLWMTAGGNSDTISRGKRVLIWAILGIIVIGSAFVVTNALFNAVLTGSVDGTQTSTP